jgi:fused signal recognition particle receptor
MTDWAWLPAAAAVVLLAVVLGVVLAVRRRRRATRGRSATAASTPSAPSDRVHEGLATTRRRLAAHLAGVLGAARPLDSVLAEVEEALVGADVGVRTANELVGRIRSRVGRAAEPETVRTALREEVEAVLRGEEAPAISSRPWVVLVTGVNGAGKTTTIGKLAAMHARAGRKVLLVAGDTFRAAAADQLEVWAGRTGAAVVRQAAGANPAAVVYDGMKAARTRDVDVVLVDSAGRLHTRTNLMEELAKMRRVIAREVPGAPHETLLVLDATTGQNAVAQARMFSERLGTTGLVLTKLDGTARGGVVVAVRREVGLPVRYIGVGEGVDDLRPFDAGRFADALLGTDGETASGRNP